MIDFDTWQGAQWILAFWLVLTVSLFPAVGVYMRPKSKTIPEWIGVYLSRLASSATLFAILAWGGFWA